MWNLEGRDENILVIDFEFLFTVWLNWMTMAKPIEMDAFLVGVDRLDIQNKCRQNSRKKMG